MSNKDKIYTNIMEVLYDRKGFIEVGYVVSSPFTLNIEYAGEGSEEP